MVNQWEVHGRHQSLNLLYKVNLVIRVEKPNKDFTRNFLYIDQEVTSLLILEMIYLKYGINKLSQWNLIHIKKHLCHHNHNEIEIKAL